MKSTKMFLVVVLAVVASRFACKKSNSDHLSQAPVQSLPSPANEENSAPNLFSSAEGKLYLSWIATRGEKQYALRFSTLRANAWSPAKTIAEGHDWFVNWADIPSLRVLNNGVLAVHWLAKTGAQKYAYAVNVSLSSDDGATWSKPIVPHTDDTPTEHGFVSLLPWEENRMLAVWLDGRDYWYNRSSDEEEESEHGATSLRSAVIDMNGNLYDERILDTRVCDCCQTSAGLTPTGAIVAYRDRSEQEHRDISLVRFENGHWSQPETLFQDGWEINGCPVNGPSAATFEKEAAIAWYTAADDTAKVKIIFSHDGGRTFGRPLRVDDGDPMGRVSAALLSNDEALVCWMAMVESGAEVRVRRVHRNGRVGKSISVTPTSATRASGFPRMAVNSSDVIFAWTKLSDERSVHAAKMNLHALK